MTPQEDQLLRAALFLTEVPVGPVRSQETELPADDSQNVSPESKPGGAEDTENRPAQGQAAPTTSYLTNSSGETTAGNALLAYTAASSSEETCEEAKEIGDIELAASACSWNDQDWYWNSYYGEWQPYWFTCGTWNRWNQHDDDWHCMQDWYSYSGPGTAYCNGRCGYGCGPYSGGLFSLDCLDHDSAVAHRGYTNGYTYDELDYAYDDFWWERYWQYACYKY